MKLPEPQLKVYLAAGVRKAQAEMRLGTILLEYEHYKKLAMEDWGRQKAEMEAAVKAGLIELQLEPSDRHFHVMSDGAIKELINGAYVDIKEGQ
jgi:hypothetical protein